MDDLSVPTHWRLLGYLNGFFINGKQVWASNETIAQKLNVSSRSIQTAVKTLEQMDIIGTKRTKNSRIIIPNYTDKNEQNEDIGEKPTSRGEKPTSMPHRNQLHPNSDNNSVSNKDIAKDEPLHKEISQIIKSFETINPACKSFYGNKTQRKACESLINEYGYDRVLFVVEKTLEITNQKEYLPNIQTPVQLFQKWSSLENGIKKIKNKGVTEQQKKGNLYW